MNSFCVCVYVQEVLVLDEADRLLDMGFEARLVLVDWLQRDWLQRVCLYVFMHVCVYMYACMCVCKSDSVCVCVFMYVSGWLCACLLNFV